MLIGDNNDNYYHLNQMTNRNRGVATNDSYLYGKYGKH
ncbi:Putative uncharacterized protein [Moritella viscosa]|nr:Putative uncharacterized protein [Moritella viscosa]SHO21193.1 Putative uncharacterized protein [Moritella viscosa]